jgi:hypothetical protein
MDKKLSPLKEATAYIRLPFLVLAGAGISIPAPANMPSANDITRLLQLQMRRKPAVVGNAGFVIFSRIKCL